MYGAGYSEKEGELLHTFKLFISASTHKSWFAGLIIVVIALFLFPLAQTFITQSLQWSKEIIASYIYSSNSTNPPLLHGAKEPGHSGVIKVGPDTWGKSVSDEPQLEFASRKKLLAAVLLLLQSL